MIPSRVILYQYWRWPPARILLVAVTFESAAGCLAGCIASVMAGHYPASLIGGLAALVFVWFGWRALCLVRADKPYRKAESRLRACISVHLDQHSAGFGQEIAVCTETARYVLLRQPRFKHVVVLAEADLEMSRVTGPDRTAAVVAQWWCLGLEGTISVQPLAIGLVWKTVNGRPEAELNEVVTLGISPTATSRERLLAFRWTEADIVAIEDLASQLRIAR